MQLKSLNVYFFFLLFALVTGLVSLLFQPFLTAVVAAAILTAFFKRPYHTLERWTRGRKSVSAFLTCLLAVVVIVTPVSLVLSLAIGEAGGAYHAVSEPGAPAVFIQRGIDAIRGVPYLNIIFDTRTFNQERLIGDIRQFSQNALGILQAAYQGVTGFLFFVFVMFFTLYYFLIDGKAMLRRLTELSPLRNDHDRLLIEKFVSISRSTLKGTLIIGALQGVIGATMFWVAGIPSPVIWGLVMMLASVIPVAGTGLVWLPAAVILFLLGHLWPGVFILAVGFGVISVIDNLLRPKLVGRDTRMHPLMVLFATLGGIALFGLAGFILGPIIVSLFLALAEIYSIEFREQLKEYNQ